MKKILITALLTVLLSQYAFAQFLVGGEFTFGFQQLEHVGLSGTNDVTIHSGSFRTLISYRFGIASVGMLYEYIFFAYFNRPPSFSIPSWSSFSSFGIGIFGELQLFSRGNFFISGRGSFLFTRVSGRESSVGSYFREELRIDLEPIFEFTIFDRFSFFTNVGLIRFHPAALDRTTSAFAFSIFTAPTVGFRYLFEN